MFVASFVASSFAALQLSNLLYVAAAIVVATLISALIALRHRRPKSLESGIESFSRELRALAPEPEATEGRVNRPPARLTGVAVRPRRPAATREATRRPRGEHYRGTERFRPTDNSERPETPHARPQPGASSAPLDQRNTSVSDAAVNESTRTEGQAG